MSGTYDDIIHLSRPVSPRRRRMSMVERAAQFSPFAALTGFDAAIRESGRLTERQVDLGMDAAAILDEKLRLLAEHLSERPEVTLIHFVPDARKSGGTYVETAGRLYRMDRQTGTIMLENGCVIPFDRIYEISSDLFP